MKQSFFKSLVVALFVVATLASTKSAKADLVGIGLGYEFNSNLIAVDFLVPIKHHGAKRPQGGIVNFGLRIRGADNKRSGLYSENWIHLAIPIAYEHVFDSGISIIAGAEFRYFDLKQTVVQPSQISNPDNNAVSERRLGGGIVLGSHYFFKSGVFLGWQIAAGAVSYKEVYQTRINNRRSGIYGYGAPTLSVGYMF